MAKGGYEGKFAIRTDFLDTTLRWEEESLPNETPEEYWDRLDARARAWAAKKRDEINQQYANVPLPDYSQYRPTGASLTTSTIINRKDEEIEIAIDNANTLEELKKVKEFNPVMPHKLLVHYNKRLSELTQSK